MRTPNFSFVSLALLGVLIACIAGCTTARIGGDLSQADPEYPVEMLSPRQVVDIRGLLPSSLDVKLKAHYGATIYKGCRYTPTLIAGAVEGVTFPIRIAVPLEIVRDRERYSASFIVDRFQSGRCGWQFTGVSAEVSKAGMVSIANNIVSKEHESFTNESWAYNSQDTAVVWRCRFSQLANLSKGSRMFACGEDSQKYKDKFQHRLNNLTKTIEVDFIDLEP